MVKNEYVACRIPASDINKIILPQNLRVLSAEDTHLKSEVLQRWDLANCCKNLKRLSLGETGLTNIEYMFPSGLVSLELKGNNITIPNEIFFENFKDLEYLGISQIGLNKFTQSGKQIRFPHSLITLDIGENNLYERDFRKLVLHNCKKLRYLKIQPTPERNIKQLFNDLKISCPLLASSEFF